MNWREHISSDPEIMFGKMVNKGHKNTRRNNPGKIGCRLFFWRINASLSPHHNCRCSGLLIVCGRQYKTWKNFGSSIMNYQIVADESVDFRIVVQLREVGLTVYSIAEEQPSITDNSVLSIACDKQALLLTEDKDFGELVFRLQLPHHGILLIRIERSDHKIFQQYPLFRNIMTTWSIGFPLLVRISSELKNDNGPLPTSNY